MNSSVAVPPPMVSKDYGIDRSKTRLHAAKEMVRQGALSREESVRVNQLLQQNTDPLFQEIFDKALQTGDLTNVKKAVAKIQDDYDPVLSLTSMSLNEEELLSTFFNECETDSGLPLGPPEARGGLQHARGNLATPPSIGTSGLQNMGFPMNNGLGSQSTTAPHAQHRQSVGFGSEFSRLTQGQGGHGNPNAKAEAEDHFSRKRQVSRSAPVQGMNKAVAAQPTHTGVIRRAVEVPQGAAFPGSAVAMHAQQRSSQLGQVPPPLHGVSSNSTNGKYKPIAIQYPPKESMTTSLSQFSKNSHVKADFESEGDKLGQAKSRKNERERKRRLAVTQGFDELYKLLKEMEDDQTSSGILDNGINVSATSKLDKASLLKSSIYALQNLEHHVRCLHKDNERLKALRHQAPTQPVESS